jgi:FixJ family two-component response regulator
MDASTPPLIHVVDDDDNVRVAMINLLSAAGYQVRGYACAADFLGADSEKRAGCILLDVLMPGLSGLELHEELAKRGNATPVIYLSAHADIPMSVSAMKAGAVDFLTKPVDSMRLLKVLKEALARNVDSRAEDEGLKVMRQHCDALTARELEVYTLVAAGLLNKQIAAELDISERTVKAHRARVMEKMQAHSLAELMYMATLLKLSPARTPFPRTGLRLGPR